MKKANLTHSKIKILKGKYNDITGTLKLSVEIEQGNLPQKGDYIFLKEEPYSSFPSEIISIKKQFFKPYYYIKIDFSGMKETWNEEIERYILETGDRYVYCGISPKKYSNLEIHEKKEYINFIIDLLSIGKAKTFLTNHIDSEIQLLETNRITNKLTKKGGLPELPINIDFPKDKNGKPLLFLGQIHTLDIKSKLDSFTKLNKNGIIYFFASIDEKNKEYPSFGEIKIIYNNSDKGLIKKNIPNEIKDYGYFKEYDITISNEISIPNIYAMIWINGELSKKEESSYEYIQNILEYYFDYTTKMFGFPAPVQDCVLVEAELKEKNLLWYGKEKYNKEEIKKTFSKIKPDFEKWLLLFQFEASEYNELSEYKKEFNKYNDGVYYVLIKQEDMKNLNFNNIITIFQST